MCSYLVNKCPTIFYNIIRFLLYAFTFLLITLGVCLMCFSFWYLYEGRDYQLDNSTAFSISFVTFSCGLLLFLVTLCGLVGVLRENLCLTKLYLGCVIVLLLVELVSVSLLYLYKHKIMEHANVIFEDLIHDYADDDDIRIIVDTIQSNLHCCGISSSDDWESNAYYSCSSISTFKCSVPSSCCRSFSINSLENNFFCGIGMRNATSTFDSHKKIYHNGCKFAIYEYMNKKQNIKIIILIAVMISQFVGILLLIGYIFSLNYIILNNTTQGNDNLYLSPVRVRRSRHQVHDQAPDTVILRQIREPTNFKYTNKTFKNQI